MTMEGLKFGNGPKELGGTIDLIDHFRLLPHHEFFCNRALPESISESHYLRNVVGDTVIKKGEGMELDQLYHNISGQRDKNTYTRPVGLHMFRDTSETQESAEAEKSISSPVVELKNGLKDSVEPQERHMNREKRKNDNQRQKKDHPKVPIGDRSSASLPLKAHDPLKKPKKKRRHDAGQDPTGAQRQQISQQRTARIRTPHMNRRTG